MKEGEKWENWGVGVTLGRLPCESESKIKSGSPEGAGRCRGPGSKRGKGPKNCSQIIAPALPAAAADAL